MPSPNDTRQQRASPSRDLTFVAIHEAGLRLEVGFFFAGPGDEFRIPVVWLETGVDEWANAP